MSGWQDYVLALCSFIFSLALIPSIIGSHKPEFSTSVVTGSLLLVYSAVYFSLGLWIAGIANTVSAILWLILAEQRKWGYLDIF